MGAFADFDAYQQRLNRFESSNFNITTGGRSARLLASWRYSTPAAAIPTTSSALSGTSDVALAELPAVNTGRLTVLGSTFSQNQATSMCLIVADILNHSGGLDGTITTEQTTNLPTAALTRYTSGEGVMAGILIYSTIGSTGTTYTVKYTNQNGTSGKISSESVIGVASYREPGALLPVPLVDGDTGVRSVESVTLGSSTGVAGNVGVILFKPLAMMAIPGMGGVTIDAVTTGGFVGALAQAEPNACLSLIHVTPNVNGVIASGSLLLAEV